MRLHSWALPDVPCDVTNKLCNNVRSIAVADARDEHDKQPNHHPIIGGTIKRKRL